MKKIKLKILKFESVDSSGSFLFDVCKRLKMVGWQFDKLTIEEKILKWLNRNIDKELSFEINKDSVLKKIKETQSTKILSSYTKIPEGYEIGNPLNRWIHNDAITRTQEQINEDTKRIKTETEKEYKKIEEILDSIKVKCGIKINLI